MPIPLTGVAITDDHHQPIFAKPLWAMWNAENGVEEFDIIFRDDKLRAIYESINTNPDRDQIFDEILRFKFLPEFNTSYLQAIFLILGATPSFYKKDTILETQGIFDGTKPGDDQARLFVVLNLLSIFMNGATGIHVDGKLYNNQKFMENYIFSCSTALNIIHNICELCGVQDRLTSLLNSLYYAEHQYDDGSVKVVAFPTAALLHQYARSIQTSQKIILGQPLAYPIESCPVHNLRFPNSGRENPNDIIELHGNRLTVRPNRFQQLRPAVEAWIVGAFIKEQKRRNREEGIIIVPHPVALACASNLPKITSNFILGRL